MASDYTLFSYPDQLHPKKVHLLGKGRHEEGVAGGTITPGMLIALASTGKYVAHPTAGGAGEKAFAVEDALQARTLDDNYAADERVSFVIGGPSDVIYAFLDSGEAVVQGDQLESNGDGTFRKHASGVAIAISLDTLDLSASSAAGPSRLRVRVI